MKVIKTKKAVAQQYNLEGFLSSKLDEIKAVVSANNRVELVSPTGSGKTTAIKQLVKEYETAVILLPYNSLLSLYEGFWVVSSSNGHLPQKRAVNVMIYDQAVKYKEFIAEADLLVVDEEHCQFFDKTYRDSAIEADELLKAAKKILFVSATPVKREAFLLEYKRKDNRQVDINVVRSKNNQKTLDELTDFDGKVCVFSNQYFQKSLSVGLRLETSIGVYCSENNENVVSQLHNLLKTEKLTKKINFFTSAAFQGLNIRNEEKIRVVILNDMSLSLQDVKQIIGRFRAADLEVWVIGSPLKETSLEVKKMIYEAGNIDNRLTRNFDKINEVVKTVESCSLEHLIDEFPEYDRTVWEDDNDSIKIDPVNADELLDAFLTNPKVKDRVEERLRVRFIEKPLREEKLFMKLVGKITEEAVLFRKLTKCGWNSCIRKANAYKNINNMTEEDFQSLIEAYKSMIGVAKTVDKTIEKQLLKTLEEIKDFRSIKDLKAELEARKSKRMKSQGAQPIKVVSIELGKCCQFESISEFCKVVGGKQERASKAFKDGKDYKGFRKC